MVFIVLNCEILVNKIKNVKNNKNIIEIFISNAFKENSEN